MTDDQRETLTTVALFAGLALAVIGGVMWATAPKPPSCNAQAQDVTAAEEYLNDIPRSTLGSLDVNASLRQQAQARLKAAESAQASCRLARSAAATSSGREDMGVKVGIAGLAIAGVAAFTLWRDKDEDTETVHVESERVATAPPAPQGSRADDVYSQLRDLNPDELQRLADLADANRAAEREAAEDYPAYAEDVDTYTESEASRTRSGWGSASKRRLTFGDDEGSDA